MKAQSEHLSAHSVEKTLAALGVFYLCVIVLVVILSIIIFIISSRLMAAKDRALAAYTELATLQIAEATQQISEANEMESVANHRAMEAQRQAAISSNETAQIKAASIAEAAIARRQVATLNAQAARLTAVTVQLEQQIAARHLTVEQASNLILVLEHFKGQRIKVEADKNDHEASQYASELIHVFRAAKWQVSDDTELENIKREKVGVQAQCNPEDCGEGHWLPGLIILSRTLYSLKILPELSVLANPEIEPKVICLFIGSKPPFDQAKTDNAVEARPRP